MKMKAKMNIIKDNVYFFEEITSEDESESEEEDSRDTFPNAGGRPYIVLEITNFATSSRTEHFANSIEKYLLSPT